jgi:hypothetical protein
VLEFWSGYLVFSVTKSQGRILPTQLITAWVSSSSLTFNAFKFGCDLCLRSKDVPGERGLSKIFEVFSRQAHVMTTGKALWFAACCHGAPVMWRPNWRLPKNSLAHSILIRFTWGYSYVKSLFASPIKGDGPALVKGIDFWEIYCWERAFGFLLFVSEFWV